MIMSAIHETKVHGRKNFPYTIYGCRLPEMFTGFPLHWHDEMEIIYVFSGSVIIENTFSLNGMGKLYWQGLNNMDFELVLAIQMFYSIVSLIGSLLIDISYGLVDPRVRVDK